MKRIFTLLLFLISFAFFSNAQPTFPVNGVTDPRHLTYVFTNATVYVDYKTNIPNATLIIKDGLVIDAGANIAIPADAIIYDLKGKTIYPSFIDIFTDYGLPEIKKPAPSDSPQMQSAIKGAYDWNQAI